MCRSGEVFYTDSGFNYMGHGVTSFLDVEVSFVFINNHSVVLNKANINRSDFTTLDSVVFNQFFPPGLSNLLKSQF